MTSNFQKLPKIWERITEIGIFLQSLTNLIISLSLNVQFSRWYTFLLGNLTFTRALLDVTPSSVIAWFFDTLEVVHTRWLWHLLALAILQIILKFHDSTGIRTLEHHLYKQQIQPPRQIYFVSSCVVLFSIRVRTTEKS